MTRRILPLTYLLVLPGLAMVCLQCLAVERLLPGPQIYLRAARGEAGTPLPKEIDLFRVEVVVNDPRFKDLKTPIMAPPLSLPIRVERKKADQPQELRVGKDVVFDDPAFKALFHPAKISLDGGKIKVVLEPRVLDLAVKFPRGKEGATGAEPEKGVEFETSADKGWQPAPAEAIQWKLDPGKTSATLVVLPAAFGAEKAARTLRVTMKGLKPAHVDLADALAGSGSSEVALGPAPLHPDLPPEARAYANLKGLEQFVSYQEYVGKKSLWTKPMAAKRPPPDESYYVVPGFVPVFASLADGKVKLYAGQVEEISDGRRRIRDVYLDYNRWPGQLRAGKLLMGLRVAPPAEFRGTSFNISGGKVAIHIFGDKLVADSPINILIDSEGRRQFYCEFILPELYNKAAALAKEQTPPLPPEKGFEELETRAKLVFSGGPSSTKGLFELPDRPFDSFPHSNFGLQDLIFESGKWRELERPHLAQLSLRITPAKCEVKVQVPEGVDPTRSMTFSTNRSNLKSPDHYFWSADRKTVTFLPALLHENFSSTKLRAELPGLPAIDLDLIPGKPLELLFRRVGLDLRLPVAALPKGAAQLLVTLPGERNAKIIPVEAKAEQSLTPEEIKSKLGVSSIDGAHVELRIPGYRPLVEPKLSGKTLDATKLEPTEGKKYLVVINNWAQIITPNDDVRTNINSVQREVCKALIDQATKDNVDVAGFVLVDKKEAAWPPGDPNAAFVFTGGKLPLGRKDRRVSVDPDENWPLLRTLLMNQEVAGKHDEIRVVLVTPYQRPLKEEAKSEEKDWLLERTKKYGLRFHTVVVGGPEASATTLEKQYLEQTHFLRVGKMGIDYGDGMPGAIEKLPEWVNANVWKKLYP